MAEKLKDALERNRIAAQELDAALKDCLAALKDEPEVAAEARFRVVNGGRSIRQSSA